jgi:hypothetical protein
VSKLYPRAKKQEKRKCKANNQAGVSNTILVRDSQVESAIHLPVVIVGIIWSILYMYNAEANSPETAISQHKRSLEKSNENYNSSSNLQTRRRANGPGQTGNTRTGRRNQKVQLQAVPNVKVDDEQQQHSQEK